MLKRWVAVALLVGASVASAQTAAPAVPPSDGKAKPGAIEEQIRARLQARVGAKADAVTKTPFGLYEVVIGTDVVYVDAAVNYVIAGRVIDARTREDLTAKRRDELLKVDFKALPLDQAVKVVRGDGSRIVVTFEDPNCTYCKKLYKDLRGMTNVTIYTFLYPILSPDSFEKSKAIWCAKDRAVAWDELMAENKAPETAPADCKHPLQQVLALGQKLDVTGTPTMVFPDGSRFPGAVPVERVEEKLNALARK